MLTGCQSQNTSNRVKANKTITAQANLSHRNTLNSEQNSHIKAIKSAINKNDQKLIIKHLELLALVKTNRALAFKNIYEILKNPGLANLAIETLVNIKNPTLSDLKLIASLCVMTANNKCVVEANFRQYNHPTFDNKKDSSRLNNQLWNHLIASENEEYEIHSKTESDWLDLADKFKATQTISQKVVLWENWKKTHLNHPIVLNPPNIFVYLENFQPPSIAVILPLSGDLKSAGIAARDGIIANHLSEQNSYRGELNFYDSESTNMESILEQIKESHATLIIGPLLKHNSEIFTVLSQEEIIPTLLLNYLEDPSIKSRNQYSIGLSIEDEIDELVSHLKSKAYDHILVVSNNSPWATRSNSLFIEKWPVSSTIASFERASDMTTNIGFAAGSQASFDRKTALSKLIKPQLEFLPRSRKDIDAMVVFVAPLESSILEPILKFHYLDSVPIYATSQSELYDLKFDSLSALSIEFPFIIQKKDRTLSLKRQFSLTNRLSQELFALGLDAYKLAQILPIVSKTPKLTLPGQIGIIELTEHNTFKRKFELTQN